MLENIQLYDGYAGCNLLTVFHSVVAYKHIITLGEMHCDWLRMWPVNNILYLLYEIALNFVK